MNKMKPIGTNISREMNQNEMKMNNNIIILMVMIIMPGCTFLRAQNIFSGVVCKMKAIVSLIHLLFFLYSL